MTKRTTHIARQPWGHDDYSRPMAISLAAEPFDIPPACADETAPRSTPVRGIRRRVTLGRSYDLSVQNAAAQYDEPQEVTL